MLEHGDHFDMYGTDEGLLTEGVYAQQDKVQLVSDPDGLSTQRCLFFPTNESGVLRYVYQSNEKTSGCAQRIWLTSLPASGTQDLFPYSYRGANNAVMVELHVDTTGRISLIHYSDGTAFPVQTVIGTTDAPVITAEGWWHLEHELVCSTDDDSDDARFELRVEGVTVLEVENFSTWEATTYQAQIYTDEDGIGVVPGMYLKDLAIRNDQGDDNTTFLGAVLAINCVPNEDVTLGEWLPSTGFGTEGWPILDNNPPNDSQYMSAFDPDFQDPMEFEMTNLPPEISSVKGVFTYVRARKIDGGDGQMQVAMLSSAVASNGVDRPITVGYIYWKDLHERDPNIDAPWTRTTVDNSQIRIDRTV